MSFSLFSDTKEKTYLLIDIGNGSINTALVSYEGNKLPKFLHTETAVFPVYNSLDKVKLLDAMDHILNEMIVKIMNNGFIVKKAKEKRKILSGALVTFSSPWFISKTKHIHIEKDFKFVITQDFLNDIVEKEGEIFKQDILKEESANLGNSFEVIEKSVVHIKINGYVVNQSMGIKTNNMDAFLCMSIVDSSILSKINNILLRNASIPKENIKFHTFPVASFSVFRDIFINYDEFLIMDITGEVTDLTLVQRDIIISESSFPFGRNSIIRKISQELNVSNEIAESTIRLYISKKIDPATSVKVEEIIGNLEKEWAVYLSNSMISLSPDLSIPPRLYLTVDEDIAGLFINFIKLPKMDDLTSSFRKKVNIIHINQKLLMPFYQSEPNVKTNEFLAILGIFYNKVK